MSKFAYILSLLLVSGFAEDSDHSQCKPLKNTKGEEIQLTRKQQSFRNALCELEQTSSLKYFDSCVSMELSDCIKKTKVRALFDSGSPAQRFFTACTFGQYGDCIVMTRTFTKLLKEKMASQEITSQNKEIFESCMKETFEASSYPKAMESAKKQCNKKTFIGKAFSWVIEPWEIDKDED